MELNHDSFVADDSVSNLRRAAVRSGVKPRSSVNQMRWIGGINQDAVRHENPLVRGSLTRRILGGPFPCLNLSESMFVK